MATEVIMPKLGLTMTEGKIMRWVKKEGDTVTAGETLFIVETDKVTLEVEATASGTVLKTFYKVGDTVPLETVIAYIGQPGEEPVQAPHPAERPGSSLPEAKSLAVLPAAQENQAAGPIKISPLAKKLAAVNGVDLAKVKGSGPQGRIVEEDIRSYLNLSGKEQAALGNPAGAKDIPLTHIRRVSAQRMSESFHTAPHFYLRSETNLSGLVELRKKLQQTFEKETGLHPTYTDFFLRALALTLPRHPLLNATWLDDTTIRCFEHINLGLAVAGGDGLLVGVIHDADRLSLAEIIRQRTSLIEKARANSLTLEEMSGATFTLTNLGMYGVDEFFPILNPPQSAILAVGAVSERPVGEGGGVVLRPTVRMTLAVDHRVADGADGALFLKDFQGLLTSLDTKF
jgi:pyruvate dehydrogenase E2 component (dihydrolipoamide acetyltransferase)